MSQKEDGYTPIQQFFLAYGQNWCGTTRPEQLRLQVQTDPHFTTAVPRQWGRPEHAGIRAGFRVPRWAAYDAGESLSGVVKGVSG